MPVVPFRDTALHIYKYHKDNNPNSDPKWVDKYLATCVRDEFLTQDEADSIKQEYEEDLRSESK